MLVPGAAAWEFETVDSGNVGPYASLKAGADGRLHVSYFASSLGHLKYALFDGSWSVETVDDEFLTGHHTSLDLDSSGNPQIAYRFYSGHLIRYASWTGGDWSFLELEDDADMETDISMALDGADLPHVSFYDGYFYGEAHDLKYAHFDGYDWQTVLVDAPGEVGRGSSIAVDSSGRPHISYYSETAVTLKYAHFDGADWTVATLDNVEAIGFNFRTDIAIDSQDRVHIVYSAYHYDDPSWRGRLKYAVYDGSQWTIEIIEEGAPTRDFRVPAIAVDGDDRPHVSYLIYYNSEPITADLKYAVRDGGAWQVEFIDTGDIADSDFSNSIDIDPAGAPHVAYARNGSLIHAESQPIAGVAGGGAARAGLVLHPPFPNPGRHPALRIRLPRSSAIDLGVFDIRGRRMATLASGTYPPGEHAARIEERLPPGAYAIRLWADGASLARKVVVR